MPHDDPQRDREDRDVDQERDPPADRVDQQPTGKRSDQHQPGGRGGPETEGAPALRPALEGLGDDRQRSGHEQGAGRALQQPEDDEPFEGGREPAQRRRRREARKAEGVDAPTPVAVGQGAGQDQQCGEDREVAAHDVGLALEDPEHRRGQLPPDPRQRHVHDRAVQEDRPRPDDRREEGPALACRHARSLADRLSRYARTRGARRRR